MSKNKISYLEFENFINMTSLKKLDLSYNALQEIDETSFGEIRTLEKLRLKNNLIQHVIQGSFDGLLNLKLLDVSYNQLACDCDLVWLIPWAQNLSVKLTQKPKCASPVPFKDQYLSKLRVGIDLHCESPLERTVELIPDTPQLIFEGDALTLRCRAPRLAAGGIRDSEDLLPNHHSPVFWGWSETIMAPDSTQDIVYLDPQARFSSVTVDIKHLSDSGLIDSIMRIPYATRNHSGTYDCRLRSDHSAKLSRNITVMVISNKTQYCPPEVTKSNKGVYSWPKTIRGTSVTLPCQYDSGNNVVAQNICNQQGLWDGLNVTACSYIMETTRMLQGYSMLNLSEVRDSVVDSVVDSARQLRNYTNEQIITGQLLDPMDLFYLAKSMNNLLDFVPEELELGSILLDIISYIMNLNRMLLNRSQSFDMICNTFIKIIEQIGLTSPSTGHAIDMFRIASEKYNGLTCTWMSFNKEFECVPPNNYHMLPFNEKTIEASIQLPTSLVLEPNENLLITVFRNSNLFPQNKTNFLITSAVIGVKVKNVHSNLTEPVHIMLKPKPFHDEKSGPRPVIWDPEQGVWTNQGCNVGQLSHITGLYVFTCNRLGYYGLLQNTIFLNDFDDLRAGRKFRLSPPGFYIGSFILFGCLWINITTYTVAGNMIHMSRRIKHALVNTWIALSGLVFFFSVGVYQTESFEICQIFGITLHYFCLSVLLWICVIFSQFHRNVLRKNHRVIEDGIANGREKKPISGLYFVGWGIGLIICGLSGAINMEEYATYHYCFMKPTPAISAIFIPTLIILFYIIITLVRIRFTIKTREISMHMAAEGEHYDLDAINDHVMNRSVSMSTRTTTDHSYDHEHSLRAQVKSHVIVLVLVLETWIVAAVAVVTPFTDNILYEEEILSVIYAVSATILGLFILFFYGISRSDVRIIWSTINCHVTKNHGYSCRPTNVVTFTKDYPTTHGTNMTNTMLATPTVVYQTNISRSNSQSSKSRPMNGCNTLPLDDNPKPNLINVHRRQFVHNNGTMNSRMTSDLESNPEIFYNPNQSHVARKFFRKQKRLQKQNNIEIQRRQDIYGGDASSDISSVMGCPALNRKSNYNELLSSGSKVNNLNINMNQKMIENSYTKDSRNQFSSHTMNESDPELFMNVCQDSLRLSGKKLNNDVSSHFYSSIPDDDNLGLDNAGTIKIDDKYKRAPLVEIPEEEPSFGSPLKQILSLSQSPRRGESPQYVNSPAARKQQLALEPTYFELEPPNSTSEGLVLTLNSPLSAMNTVGLPMCRSHSGSLRSNESLNDSLNTVMNLEKFEAYVSAACEITNHVTMKDDGSTHVFDTSNKDKCKSMTELSQIHDEQYQESKTKSISCADLLNDETFCSTDIPPPENIQSPVLLPPDMSDFPTPPAPEDLKHDFSDYFNGSSFDARTSSPTNFSEFYQHSEISIQSQDFYAPQENDLNIILAANLNFQISDDDDDDDNNIDEDEEDCIEDEGNCSRDYLISQESDPLNESGSIDELYQQIKRNSNWRRKEDEDFLNENSASESSSRSCCQEDVINDN